MERATELVVSIPTAALNGATLTIPLQLRIAIELAGAPVALAAAAPVESADQRAALAELERAGERTYYDAAQDATDRAAYYAGVAPGDNATDFYRALGRLLRDTHARRPAYRPGTRLYPWIDLQPNGKLRSIYTGHEFAAAAFIADFFAIEARRTAVLTARLAALSAQSAEAVQHELDRLEAAAPFNCEHVVPQSWFSKKEPMRGDLHHLFACQVACNTYRDNIPYYDFPEFEPATPELCGKRDGLKFEPAAGKGAVARATLYFLLRYPGQINRTANEYTADRLPILLAWHAAAPPDEYEQHRNQGIFAAQGNRNPLIDHPDWATKIDFTQGLG